MADPLATVIIVNFNGAHLLPACLDAVRAQDTGFVTGPGSFDTVVVDNASTDGSVELLARDYPWVRVIASPTNTGFAGGNNLALHECRTPYAVLLNNDAIAERDWLRSLLAAFEGPDGDQLAAVTGKVVFLPQFVRLEWEMPGFSPGPHDPRELGVQVYAVAVHGRDVTDKVLWESLSYGPEGGGEGRFRWTRPTGHCLVPVRWEPGPLDAPLHLTLRLAAEQRKAVSISGSGFAVSERVETTSTVVTLAIPAGTPLLDVVNNVGGIVLTEGYGADRGFQEVDEGQYDLAADVFTACGNGVALRTEAARSVGFFDDDFFMYYEDTDLSWRLRSRGWRIRYEPTAVLRHIHAASSKEWSPFWVFHVDRNRLLMLVKNGSARLVLATVPHYLLTAASMAVRAGRAALRSRSRPELRPHLVRAKVMLSFLRLAGPMITRRLRVGREATVSRRDLERWLVAHR